MEAYLFAVHGFKELVELLVETFGDVLLLRGRLGFVVGGRTLLYAKGGYTNAGFDTRYTSPNSTPAIDIHDKDHVDGWRLGAGAEVKLTDKFYLKGEYRYSNYSSDDAGIDAKRHQVVGGVGVRF